MPIVRPSRFTQYENGKDRETITFYLKPNAQDDEEIIKSKIKTYGGTSNKDMEAFFWNFKNLRRLLITKGHWDEATFTANTDVEIIYNYFEEFLTGAALDNWILIRQENNSPTTWRSFKEKVAKFILTKVCPDWMDPYSDQKHYLMKHKLDQELTVNEYWNRMDLLNSYLPFLLDLSSMARRSSGTAVALRQLWTWGKLSDDEMRLAIIDAMPRAWVDEFRKDHVMDADTIAIHTLIAYFSEQQQQQQRHRRMPAQMRGGGRSPDIRRTQMPRQQYWPNRMREYQQYRPARRDNNMPYRPPWRDNNSALQQQQQRRPYSSVGRGPNFRSVGRGSGFNSNYNNQRAGNNNRYPARPAGNPNRFRGDMNRSRQGSARPVGEQHHHLDDHVEEQQTEEQAEQPREEMHYNQNSDSPDYDDGTLEGMYNFESLEQALPDEENEYYEGEEGFAEEEQEYEDELFLANQDQWLSEHWTARRV